jgi:hypothetical protein
MVLTVTEVPFVSSARLLADIGGCVRHALGGAADDDHGGAFARERNADFLADAASGSGNQREFAVELKVHENDADVSEH